jgi:hypothetical protein
MVYKFLNVVLFLKFKLSFLSGILPTKAVLHAIMYRIPQANLHVVLNFVHAIKVQPLFSYLKILLNSRDRTVVQNEQRLTEKNFS